MDTLVALEGGASTAAFWVTHGSQEGLPALAVLRMMRLVRPLRTLNRFPSVRVVVDALARSARGMASILLVRRSRATLRGARRGGYLRGFDLEKKTSRPVC
jgi:hypothetical protein